MTSTPKLDLLCLWLLILHARIPKQPWAAWGLPLPHRHCEFLNQGVYTSVTNNLQLTNLISFLGLSEVWLIHCYVLLFKILSFETSESDSEHTTFEG